MKQFFKMFFASLLAMVVAGVILILIALGSITALVSRATKEKDNTAKAGSVLVVDLGKKITENGIANSLASFSGDNSYEPGLFDMTRAIAKAKTDNNIKGILIKMAPVAGSGWASIQQLRMALKDFKTSGKFIYAYGENVSQGAYFVASVADSVYVNPVGELELKGFATVMPFLKNLLDRVQIQPEIYYAGKFKSATEPLRADKMSEPNRLQIEVYQNSLWNEFLAAAAEHSHTSAADVNQLAQTGAILFPADAVKYKLADGLLYWDEVEKRMRAKTRQNDTEAIKYIDLNDYAVNSRYDHKISTQRIAVLYADGDITDGDEEEEGQIVSKPMVEEIRKLAKNNDVKAVVLRVNSPGGSALASEIILRELQLLKQKKPLIVSMGDYAASGGYYISCQADSIFALPNTLTGSIGVFSMMFNVEGLMKNKLGVNFDEVKNAPYADFPTVSRPLTADEGDRMQRSVDNIYNTFKSRVSVGRKLSPADVDSIAQGRVWTGKDALKIGLVDGLGDLNRAIVSAAKMAKVTDYKVVTYPEPVDKFQMIMKRLKGNSAVTAMVKENLKQELGTDYDWLERLTMLKKMNGRAMMTMPFVMSVK